MRLEEHMSYIKELDHNPYIQIPNSLAKEITRACRDHDSESYSHYGYSFLVLNGFLYKYTNYINISNKEYINMGDMKEILKYNPKNQKLDIVTRRNTGILEQEGHVTTTTDIPISYEHIDCEDKFYNDRKILHSTDVGEDFRSYIYTEILRTPNYYSYIPTFMTDSRRSKGSLNNYENTFRLNYSEFEYFIFNDDFNLREFFVYCYIKSSKDERGMSEISYEKFKRQTGISKSTVVKITKRLENEGIIDIISSGNKSYKKRNPNKYRIRDEFIINLSKDKKCAQNIAI